MPRRAKQKADHRADNRGGPWAGLPHCVIDSLAYRDLSLWSRAVLTEIVREMNGYNNGEIGLSQRQLANRLGTSNFRQIGRAIAELMEHGFIDIAVEGKWKQRLARQYRLTFVNTGSPGRYRPATNEYRHWQPTRKSGVEPGSAEAVDPAEPVSAGQAMSAEHLSATLNEKQRKTFSASAEKGSSLICKPYPCAQDSGMAAEVTEPAQSIVPSSAIDGMAAQEAMRCRITAHWTRLDRPARAAWARQMGLSFEELRDFTAGAAHLPFTKLIALNSATRGGN
jgi:hypothetical protein